MLVVAASLLAGTVNLAFASDMGIPSNPTSASFDWSGTYAGVSLGYGWGGSDFVDNEYNGAPPFPVVNWETDSDGFLPGFQAGYNWQHKNTVFGVEGELGHLDLLPEISTVLM